MYFLLFPTSSLFLTLLSSSRSSFLCLHLSSSHPSYSLSPPSSYGLHLLVFSTFIISSISSFLYSATLTSSSILSYFSHLPSPLQHSYFCILTHHPYSFIFYPFFIFSSPPSFLYLLCFVLLLLFSISFFVSSFTYLFLYSSTSSSLLFPLSLHVLHPLQLYFFLYS
jgi:hypothetical protein